VPIARKVVGSAGTVSLDEKSARTLARARISRIIADRDESLRRTIRNLPKKRHAWLRAIQRSVSLILGESLLLAGATNRQVLFVCLDPVDDRPGWLEMTCYLCRFDREPESVTVALLSAHAIAQLMVRRRDVDPIAILKSEILKWTLLRLMDTEREPYAILPTETGYFTMGIDEELGIYVFTTWLANRQLTDREQRILAMLRKEERLGFSEKLADVV